MENDESQIIEPQANIKKVKWDSSIIIALIAVLISSVSAFISLKESKIMMAQQELLAEQQEASVWPYLENTNMIDYDNDTTVVYQFIVTNKGVGPAIIDSVTYLFDGRSILKWGLGQALQEKYPELEISLISNQSLDRVVLAPGEEIIITTNRISKRQGDTTSLGDVINDFDYHLEYCYCSVYGKCWRVFDMDNTKPSVECVFREDIR